MTGMEHAIEQAAARFEFTDEEWREYQAIPDQGYSHRDWLNNRMRQKVETLAETGWLAPAPLRQEWSTADDEIDAHTCCGYEDRAVIEAHAARCGYQIVHRWVTDWIEAEADQ